jgi:hypothetical protein
MFDYAASIARGETSLDAMMANGRRNLAFAAENLVRAKGNPASIVERTSQK